jgi:hypothetical protein
MKSIAGGQGVQGSRGHISPLVVRVSSTNIHLQVAAARIYVNVVPFRVRLRFGGLASTACGET